MTERSSLWPYPPILSRRMRIALEAGRVIPAAHSGMPAAIFRTSSSSVSGPRRTIVPAVGAGRAISSATFEASCGACEATISAWRLRLSAARIVNGCASMTTDPAGLSCEACASVVERAVSAGVRHRAAARQGAAAGRRRRGMLYPSFSLRILLTRAGFAFPWEAFITWPTNQPIAADLPARY